MIWYTLHNLKNVKNTHGGVILLVKLQAEASNFAKSNTPPSVFFTFFKLCKWYQIAQSITNIGKSKLWKVSLLVKMNSAINIFRIFNPFLASAPILYHLKTPKILWLSGDSRGYKMGTLGENRLRSSHRGSL